MVRIKEYNNRNRILIIIALAFFLFSISFLLYKILDAPLERKVYDFKFNVGENIGFDLNTSALIYGKSPPGTQVRREIIVQNEYNFSVKIEILASKNLEGLISLDKDYIILAKESLTIPIVLDIPLNYSYGSYEGELIIDFRKV